MHRGGPILDDQGQKTRTLDRPLHGDFKLVPPDEVGATNGVHDNIHQSYYSRPDKFWIGGSAQKDALLGWSNLGICTRVPCTIMSAWLHYVIQSPNVALLVQATE